MISEANLASLLCDELHKNLTENILPFWLHRMASPEGFFFGRMDGNGRIDPEAPMGAILCGRLLWTFSAAYRCVRRPEYLEAARNAYAFLRYRMIDSEYGGVYWSVASDGTPVDTKKQFYALGFAIYGLSEYVRACGDTEALQLAKDLFFCIEKHSRDPKFGGYIEATTRAWQPIADMRLSEKEENASKTMNTHLHIIEPYTNLYRVWPDARLREAIVSMIHVFLDRILQPDGHLGLFFNDEWKRIDSNISYGHDIEASWLLLETAQVLGDEDILRRTLAATRLIGVASLEGRSDEGWMAYEMFGNDYLDVERHWWVQAETVIGLVYLRLFHNVPLTIHKAWDTWNYIKDNLVDLQLGEWYWSRLPDGSINRRDDHAGFWKCPYHNSRMCIEVMERLRNFCIDKV